MSQIKEAIEILESSRMPGNTHLLPNVAYYAVYPEKFNQAITKLREVSEQPSAEACDIIDEWQKRYEDITGGMMKKEIELIQENVKLQSRLDSAEASKADLLKACEAWMKVESEMGDKNPCPDLALRASYRKEAVKLTEAAIDKEKEGKD